MARQQRVHGIFFSSVDKHAVPTAPPVPVPPPAPPPGVPWVAGAGVGLPSWTWPPLLDPLQTAAEPTLAQHHRPGMEEGPPRDTEPSPRQLPLPPPEPPPLPLVTTETVVPPVLGSTVPTVSGQRGRSSTNQNETNILTHRPRRSTANYSLEIYARNGLGSRKMDSGNGCAVAENPATVTRSSGQTTCDAGGDDGAMLEADKECSETEHQTDDEEVTMMMVVMRTMMMKMRRRTRIRRRRSKERSGMRWKRAT